MYTKKKSMFQPVEEKAQHKQWLIEQRLAKMRNLA